MIPGVPVQFEGVEDEVIHELCKGQHAKDVFEAIKAKERQALIAQQSQGRQVNAALGQPGMAIDPFVYHAWAQKERSYDCWQKDNSLRKYLQRHFPETKIAAEKPMNKVGWMPGKLFHVEQGSQRFKKVYSSGS